VLGDWRAVTTGAEYFAHSMYLVHCAVDLRYLTVEF
jgi:hypothetical protein